MKHFLIVLLILVVIGLIAFYFITGPASDYKKEGGDTDTANVVIDEPELEGDEVAEVEDVVEEDTVPVAEVDESKTVLGSSSGGNSITAYHYGTGSDELLFVGGIHGGYAWNTALLAYELIDYLEKNPEAIPENVKVTIVPVLNPDGLEKVVGATGRFAKSAVPSTQEATVPGRFNANNVDLNRNFDCDWQESGTWQNRTVSGGDAAFSEPETAALRDYVMANKPTAVVAYYSAAGGVFASNCHDDVLLETRTLTNLYANATGYAAYEEFDFYEITGDMVNWFAKNNVPAISVLLTTHDVVEWSKNKSGVTALLKHFAK